MEQRGLPDMFCGKSSPDGDALLCPRRGILLHDGKYSSKWGRGILSYGGPKCGLLGFFKKRIVSRPGDSRHSYGPKYGSVVVVQKTYNFNFRWNSNLCSKLAEMPPQRGTERKFCR